MNTLKISFLALFTFACVDPLVVNMSENVDAGMTELGPSTDEKNRILTESILLVRILPINPMVGEVFCSAVAIQNNLLLTSATCLKEGVRYAEVKRGSDVFFRDNEPRVGLAFKYYRHKQYAPTSFNVDSHDLGVIRLKSAIPDASIVTLFEGDVSTLDSMLRIGYQRDDGDQFRRMVSFGLNQENTDEIISFNGSSGLTETPCTVTAGLVLTYKDNQAQVVAISTRGNDSCTQGGSGPIVNTPDNRTFLQDAFEDTHVDPSNEPNTIRGGLNCAQALNCYYDSCLAEYTTEEAQQQMNDLFLCAQAAQCQETLCYYDTCPEEFNACTSQ